MHRKDRLSRRQFHTAALSAATVPLVFPGKVLGANDRLGVGAIGCGGRGSHHLATLRTMREAGESLDIVAVCDVYRPRLERAAAATAAPFMTMRHEELIERPAVDIVLVATPDHWHGQHTLDAVKAGKDVYCEKPLVHWRQLGLPEELVRVTEERKRIVQVGCQRMSSTAYRQARTLIQDGAIGKPILAETGYYRIGDWGERGMPIDDPAAKPGPDLDWERFQGDAARKEFDVSRFFRWRMYWDYSGGPGTDNYVHFYTPLAYMLKIGYPDLVVATGGKYRYDEREVPDTFNLIAEYPGKLCVLCHGTQGNDFQSQGSGDAPILRGWEGTLTFEANQIVVRPTGDLSRPEKRVAIEAGTSEPRFWKELLEACRTRGHVSSSVGLNAAVATTLQMATLAMRERRCVRFDQEQKRVLV